MEIKLLTLNEMPQAVQLARGVFDYCLRKSVQYPESITAFESYVNETHVRTLMEEGRLMLWGAFEQGYLVAMSGMQSEGHITMLYVLPVYQRRGYGKQLLLAMRTYAWDRYELGTVTLTALPAWTASYFQHRRFTAIQPMQMNAAPFVYMQAKSIRQVRYEKKPVSVGALLGTVLGGVGVCLVAAVLFMATYH